MHFVAFVMDYNIRDMAWKCLRGVLFVKEKRLSDCEDLGTVRSAPFRLIQAGPSSYDYKRFV